MIHARFGMMHSDPDSDIRLWSWIDTNTRDMQSQPLVVLPFRGANVQLFTYAGDPCRVHTITDSARVIALQLPFQMDLSDGPPLLSADTEYPDCAVITRSHAYILYDDALAVFKQDRSRAVLFSIIGERETWEQRIRRTQAYG